ncbi:TPA: BrxA family protein, partial [Vibrio cholerae]
MKDLIEKMSVQDYNTAIKDIAGLKDYTLVFNIISAYFCEPNLTDSKITDENEFDIRTSKTRNKV